MKQKIPSKDIVKEEYEPDKFSIIIPVQPEIKVEE